MRKCFDCNEGWGVQLVTKQGVGKRICAKCLAKAILDGWQINYSDYVIPYIG